MSAEYTGQLVGGPDAGNLVTATVPRFTIEAEYRLWLDGPHRDPSVVTVIGAYEWNPVHGTFDWHLGGHR